MKPLAQLILAICLASTNAQAEELATYSGYFVSGFETSSFLPDKTKERWWLTGNLTCPDVRDETKDIMARGPILYIVVRASVSEKGRHGHLGAYSREVKVSETISCRKVRKDEKPNFDF